MNEPNQQDQNRWRELHELLGLREDDAPAKPTPSAPPPAEPPAHAEHAPYIAAESPLPDVEEDVELSPPALEAGMASDLDRSLPPAAEEEIPEALEEEETLPPSGALREHAHDERAHDERDRPRHGRRRGRRGQRSRRDGDENRGAPPLDLDDTEVELADDQGVAPRRRPQDADEAEPDDDFGNDSTAEDDVPRAPPQHAAEENDDDEPVETFADWNVPSWQEIVASLYRPER
jgi:hypothetical protein